MSRDFSTGLHSVKVSTERVLYRFWGWCPLRVDAVAVHRIRSKENATIVKRKLRSPDLKAPGVLSKSIRLLSCGNNHNASIRDAAFFAPLQVNGTGHFFVTVERTTGDARNFLVVDDGLAVLHDGDGSPD